MIGHVFKVFPTPSAANCWVSQSEGFIQWCSPDFGSRSILIAPAKLYLFGICPHNLIQDFLISTLSFGGSPKVTVKVPADHGAKADGLGVVRGEESRHLMMMLRNRKVLSREATLQ